MAKITNKADLNQGTEMDVNTSTKTIQLIVAGNLSNDGVTGKALYSAIYDLFISASGYQAYQFPLTMIDGPTATQLELRLGWEFADTTSISLVRDCGFAYKDTGGTITAEYACYTMAGSLVSTSDQPYYLRSSETVPTNFTFTDEFNECIQMYGDASHGNFDYTAGVKLYLREQGDTYGYYDLVTEQELSEVTYRRYLVPMTTIVDANLSVTSPSGSPYSGMTLTLGATTNTINGNVYNFAEGEIDANSGTVQQVYDWFQNLLLQTTDIDSGAGTQRGDTYGTGSLTFTGGVITTSKGLTIKNIASADESNIIHTDDTNTGRQELFVPQITINCVDSSGSSTNFATGTRVQIYNSGGASASSWASTTAYSVGDKVLRTTGAGTEDGAGGTGAGLWYECTTAGTTGGTEPTWSTTTSGTTSDGTVTWTTRVIEMYNDTPGSVSSVSVSYPSGANANTTVRYRLISVDTTTATSWIQGTLTATSENVSSTVTQSANAVYNANAIDGSTVTECSISTNGIDIFVDDPTNETTAQRIYNWYIYYLSLEAGIRDSDDLITATDQTHYTFDDSLQIKNLDTSNPLSILGANIVPTTGSATNVFDLSNGASIAMNFNRVEGFSYSSGSGLSPSQATSLDNIEALSNTINTKAGTAVALSAANLGK